MPIIYIHMIIRKRIKEDLNDNIIYLNLDSDNNEKLVILLYLSNKQYENTDSNSQTVSSRCCEQN